MAGVYRQRHPERTVLYRVLFHYFERFLEEYEHRFEKEYGYLRPIVENVVDKYMIRPILSLSKLSLDEAHGQVIYQYGKHRTESERINYLEFIT